MSGKVAIVTGGARTIGRAIALHLANDGFDIAVGIRVFFSRKSHQDAESLQIADVAANEAEALEVTNIVKERGQNATFIAADVRDEQQVQNLIASVVTQLGSLDVSTPQSLFLHSCILTLGLGNRGKCRCPPSRFFGLSSPDCQGNQVRTGQESPRVHFRGLQQDA
jgi:hypothetical protein